MADQPRDLQGRFTDNPVIAALANTKRSNLTLVQAATQQPPAPPGDDPSTGLPPVAIPTATRRPGLS